MKQIYKILFIFMLFFVGCDDKKIDSSIISKGTEMSKEAKELAQNLDKESYKDLSNVFLDTNSIDFSKDVFIIFGKNQCKYCDILKDEIKKNKDLQNALKTNFNPYYVNISYDKLHVLTSTDSTRQVSTENLARIFNVSSTPMIVFLDKNINVKYIYPGFSLKLQEMLDNVISSQKAMGDYSSINRDLSVL